MLRAQNGRRWLETMIALVLPALCGCSGFFVPVTTTTTTTTAATNVVYVTNLTTTSLEGFTVGTNALTAISGLPTNLAYQPLAMAITPNDSFLYVAGVGGIYLYDINSDGSLTVSPTVAKPAGVTVAAMTVSPDGGWLIGLDRTTQQLDIFQITASTGALSSIDTAPTYATTSGTWTPSSIVISPDGNLIFAALGTAGDVVFSFDTTTGVAASVATLQPPTTTTSDNGLAVDSTTSYLYIARSGTQGGVAVYSIDPGGSLTEVTGSPFTAGLGTYTVALNNAGTYVYAANRTDGTISGYTIVPATTTTAFTLTPLTGSPFASGTLVQSLGLDKTGTYLLAGALGGSPDLTMYGFSTTVPGALIKETTAATGTDPVGANAIVLTH